MLFDLTLGQTVPEYEEREAARFSLMPWNIWKKQPYDDRVRMVAYRRVHNSIEEHGRDAARKA